MQTIDGALYEHLKPFFYLIGLIVVSQAGMLIKLFFNYSQKKDEKIVNQIDQIKESINEMSRHVIRIETKFDLFSEHYEKDLNNLGQKVRDLNV